MEASHPTERTPLTDHRSASDSLPIILEFERSVYSDADYPAIHTVIERKIDTYTTSPSLGLTLKLLLCLRYLSGSYFQLEKADWIDSRSVEQDAAELALRCWSELQRVAWSQAALDEALWTEFHLGSGKGHTSLIETILTNQAGLPHAIQLDDRVALSLLRVWRKGRPRPVHNSRMSIIDAVLVRMESYATPRVLHTTELVFYLAYLVIFADYILSASPVHSTYGNRPDYHFYCIAIYAISRTLRDSWSSATPFVVTVVAFLSVLPGMPGRHDLSHNVLLICFVIHIIQLLLLRPPSLSLFMPSSSTLALSSMLKSLLVTVYVPAIVLFIPYCVLLLILISVSLRDIFISVQGPMAFDILFYCLLFLALLFSSLTIFMTLSTSSLAPATFHHPGVPLSWNRYGPKVGLLLRHRFSRSVITYSSSYFFPAPLNLVSLFTVRFPSMISVFLRQEQMASRLKSFLEPTLWRCLVLPLALVFGIAWLWR